MSRKIVLLFSLLYFVSCVSAGAYLIPTTLWKSSADPWFSSAQKQTDAIQPITDSAVLHRLKIKKDPISKGIFSSTHMFIFLQMLFLFPMIKIFQRCHEHGFIEFHGNISIFEGISNSQVLREIFLFTSCKGFGTHQS